MQVTEGRTLARTLGAAFAAAAASLVILLAVVPSPRALLARAPRPALAVVDRNGQPLRLRTSEEGVRARPVDLGNISPYLVPAVLAAEDRRFFFHPGVDPLALARAAWQDARAARIVSGGSTLTMQLARILDPHPRGATAKLAQIALALRLETTLGKRAILAEYLARAPMGNRVVGFEAGARVYLGKPAAQLSPAEAALLAAVPRAPSRLNPWDDLVALRARRDTILRRMAGARALDAAALRAALAEPVTLSRDPFRTEAPHFLARVAEEAGEIGPAGAELVTTLDLALQRRVELVTRQHLADLAAHGVGAIAVVVLDVERGEWLALEGSGGFWELPGGQQDGSRIPRQPGSALKPFTYACAFDRGFSPATVLPDLPRSFVWGNGTWTPRNYDERFHGPLRAREALACSVNVPAAVVLHAVGPDILLASLRAAGISTLWGDANVYGLGLTLGAGEVRLDELTAAYAALLRGGEWRDTTSWHALRDDRGHVVRRPQRQSPRRVCSPEAAAQVVDVLADPEARAAAFGVWSVLRLPFPAAVKTGTSENFRDNWCIGGTREAAVGVWAGNFDRSPMGNVSGVSGAGAVWREVMLAWAELFRRGEDLAAQPTLVEPPPSLRRVEVCALSGMVAGPDCPARTLELLRREQTAAACTWHGHDPNGATFVRLPPLYRGWAARGAATTARAALPAAADDAAKRIDASAGTPIAVTAPANEDAFVLSPDLPQRFQNLELRCAVEGEPPEVIWLVDGREHARAGAPYSARWQLEPGPHRIEAVAAGLHSAPVVVTVYGRQTRAAVAGSRPRPG
jgi:penicillin-binding protein 1C